MTAPRVLIVSPSSFNLYSGTGVLLTNLFRGWPADALAQIHGDPLPEDRGVCRRFFHVGTDEIHWSFPLSLLQAKRSPEAVARAAGGGVTLETGDSALRARLKRWVSSEFPWDAKLSPGLTAWIEEFRPDLLYVLPGGAYMRLALRIAERYDLPIVSHMMDDWPNAPMGGLFGWAVRERLRADLRALLRRSRKRFAISEAMAEAYIDRYGGDFQVFQNPADIAARLPHARSAWAAGDPFRIVYIGSILPQAQLGSLADVAAAVGALAGSGRRVRLDVHSAWSSAYPDVLREGPAVGLHAASEDGDVFERLTRADLLVLPVNFDDASRRFIRFSMPAKVPLYLVSGTPVLIYGPGDAASVRYGETAGWAEIVRERSQAALSAALVRLMDDAALRERLGRRGMEVAQTNHDAAVVRRKFQDELSGAVR